MHPIVVQLLDPDSWPDFDRPEFLDELNELADQVFEKQTIDGYLAAVLIFHQLVEELTQMILAYSDFLLQVMVEPAGISTDRRPNRMLGQLLHDISSTAFSSQKPGNSWKHAGYSTACGMS